MIFRQSNISDLQSIKEIILTGQESLAALGIDQWQDGYPSQEILLADIEQKQGYVLENDVDIVAIATVIFNSEPTYDQIDGAWLTNGEYAVVHRLATARNTKRTGMAKLMMRHIEDLCRANHIPTIKLDTHRGNIPMQNLVKSLGYVYCGIIVLQSGKERLAFEKILK